MYSLLCRHARISAFNQVPEGEEAVAADGVLLEQDAPRPNRGRWLEHSKPLQKALLGVVLLGTAFMFCDGILSPAASGMFLSISLWGTALLEHLCIGSSAQ